MVMLTVKMALSTALNEDGVWPSDAVNACHFQPGNMTAYGETTFFTEEGEMAEYIKAKLSRTYPVCTMAPDCWSTWEWDLGPTLLSREHTEL